MVKVVLVGAQESESRHLLAWSPCKGADVIGIVDNLDAFQELVCEREVDVVDIAAAVDSPEQWIRAAAMAKKHVICEGRLLEAETIRNVTQLCAEQGVQFLTANSLRFLPQYAHAHEHVHKGAIGKPGVIRMRRSAAAPSRGSANGCIFDHLGTEEFDWLRWTFGDVARVMARQVTHADESGQELKYALVLLRLVDGTIAHVELSWAEETERSSFELTGDAGMIHYDSFDSQPIALQISKREQRSSDVNRFFDATGSDLLQLRRERFLCCLSGQDPLPLSANDLISAKKIASAARQSAERGQPVTIANGGDSR